VAAGDVSDDMGSPPGGSISACSCACSARTCSCGRDQHRGQKDAALTICSALPPYGPPQQWSRIASVPHTTTALMHAVTDHVAPTYVAQSAAHMRGADRRGWYDDPPSWP